MTNQILQLLKENPEGLLAREIQWPLKLNYEQCRSLLVSLCESGVIVRTRRGPKGFIYQLKTS